jgi:hypothetical protein
MMHYRHFGVVPPAAIAHAHIACATADLRLPHLAATLLLLQLADPQHLVPHSPPSKQQRVPTGSPWLLGQVLLLLLLLLGSSGLCSWLQARAKKGPCWHQQQHQLHSQ